MSKFSAFLHSQTSRVIYNYYFLTFIHHILMAFVVLFLFIFLDLGNVKEENAKKKVMSSHIPLSLNQPSFLLLVLLSHCNLRIYCFHTTLPFLFYLKSVFHICIHLFLYAESIFKLSFSAFCLRVLSILSLPRISYYIFMAAF